MPENEYFKADILVAGERVPEFQKDGDHFVECNLRSPATYMEKRVENVSGEIEEQEYPVTPYEIKIKALKGQTNPLYYRVKVDGTKVKGASLLCGESRCIKGFRDGTSVRELLFSMPRFARDSDDRVPAARCQSIGKIEIECWMARLRTRRSEMRTKELSYEQATKKDSSSVTNGEYIMATSRVGKVLCERSFMRTVDSWKLITLLSSMTIHYRMSESLRDMGFSLHQPKHSLRTTSRLKRKDNDCKIGGREGTSLIKKKKKVNEGMVSSRNSGSPMPGPSAEPADTKGFLSLEKIEGTSTMESNANSVEVDGEIELVTVKKCNEEGGKKDIELIDLTEIDSDMEIASEAIIMISKVKEEIADRVEDITNGEYVRDKSSGQTIDIMNDPSEGIADCLVTHSEMDTEREESNEPAKRKDTACSDPIEQIEKDKECTISIEQTNKKECTESIGQPTR